MGTRLILLSTFFIFLIIIFFVKYVLTLDQICGCFRYAEINNNSFTYKQLFLFLEVSNV